MLKITKTTINEVQAMEIKRVSKVAALIIFPLALFCGRCFAEASPPTTEADSFGDWLSQGSLYGEGKTMTFFQEYGSSEMSNRRTHSFGGDIQYQSPAFQGFSFGLAGYGAYNLGLNPSDTAQVEPYLPSDNVTVLGKAYLRYQGYGLDLKAGRMNLDTPFANSGQGWTMIPALFQGLGGSYSLPINPDIKFYGYRIYRFKPFSADYFGRGDTGSPEITDTSIPSVDSNGFTTLGLRYGQLYHAKAEAWYYNFDKRAQLAFAGAEIPVQSLKVGSWTPYWGAQYVHEWDASDQAFPYENIDTSLYSARIGARSGSHDVYFVASRVPERDGAFLNGGFFAPYTFGIYDNTPLESGQPLVSMVTVNQPGTALALRYAYHSRQALAVLGVTRLELKDSPGIYYPLPAMNVNAAFMILGYNITERLHLEFEYDIVHSPNEVTGNYRSERLRLVYKFGKMMSEGDY
ncbi:hypothetical protein ACL2XO_11890 [Sodalis sp. RH15]|uniref:hypothetical protein n=1 Tax=Sodalis sp. RH15 TaxID=3394330 RepID=UPI0039B6221F